MQEQIGKKYGLMTMMSLVVGIVVGIGIFFRTGELMQITEGNTIIGLLVWVFGGIYAIVCGLTIAELSGTVTTSGGDISYAEATLGKPFAFLIGWGAVILGGPSMIAIFAWVGSLFSMFLFGLDPAVYQLPVALFYISAIFIINLITPKFAGRLQGILTIIKLIPLVLIAIFGLFKGSPETGLIQQVAHSPEFKPFQAFLAGLIPVVFTYDGWIVAAVVSGETKDPGRNVPKAIIGGLSFVMILYILVYISFITIFPSTMLSEGGVIPFGVAQELFGPVGGNIIMAGIVISALGALNGFLMGTMRKPYSLAIRGLFPYSEKFSKINERYDIPVASCVLIFGMSILFILFNAFLGENGDFSAIGSTTTLMFYTLIYGGAIVLRKRGSLEASSYKTPAFPLIPILAIGMTLFLAVGIFLINEGTTRNTLISIALFLIGLPLYYFEKKRKAAK